MPKWIQWIDVLNRQLAKIAGWSCTVLILLIVVDVAMRYIWQTSWIWMMELEIYLFAITFMLGAGYALQRDKHVRVDVFYDRWSKKTQAWVDLLGGLLFLIPWTLIIIWVGSNYSYMSWLIEEASPQPGGLPALYVLKGLIPLGMLLLGLQGLAQIYKSWHQIRSN